MIRNIIVMLCCAFFMLPAFAEIRLNVDGLSDAQIAALKAQAATMSAEAAKADDPASLLSNAASWGQQASIAAEGFAKALVVAAKEIGVSANEFLQTDAGKLTAVLIVWKVAGTGLLSFFSGMMFIALGQLVAWKIYRHLFLDKTEVVNYNWFFGVFTGQRLKRSYKPIGRLDKDGEWLAVWMIVIISIGTMAIGAAIIS